jgi:hypothetical protein
LLRHSRNVDALLSRRTSSENGVRTVSADGTTMTVAVVAIDQNGNEVPFSLVFKRFGQ